MSDTTSIPNTPNGDGTGANARSKWPLIVGALAIIAALIAVLFVISGDEDDSSVSTSDATVTTAVSATTTVTETTVETTEAPATTESPATTEVVDTTSH